MQESYWQAVAGFGLDRGRSSAGRLHLPARLLREANARATDTEKAQAVAQVAILQAELSALRRQAAKLRQAQVRAAVFRPQGAGVPRSVLAPVPRAQPAQAIGGSSATFFSSRPPRPTGASPGGADGTPAGKGAGPVTTRPTLREQAAARSRYHLQRIAADLLSEGQSRQAVLDAVGTLYMPATSPPRNPRVPLQWKRAKPGRCPP